MISFTVREKFGKRLLMFSVVQIQNSKSRHSPWHLALMFLFVFIDILTLYLAQKKKKRERHPNAMLFTKNTNKLHFNLTILVLFDIKQCA